MISLFSTSPYSEKYCVKVSRIFLEGGMGEGVPSSQVGSRPPTNTLYEH